MRRTLRQMADSGVLNAAAFPPKKAPMQAKPQPQPTGQPGQQPPGQKFPLPQPQQQSTPGMQPPELHVHVHPPSDSGDDNMNMTDPNADPNSDLDPSDQEDPTADQDPSDTQEQTPGSPMAQHIAQHMQDPLGATKKTFSNLTKTSLAYKQAQEEAKRSVIPAMSVLQHVSNAHNLQPAMPGMDPNNPDQSMGYDPQTGQPTNMMQQPGAQQMNNPQNARMGVGNAPPIPGTTPGNAATGAQTQVRPPKMGMPQPGQSQSGTRAGNPSQPTGGKKGAAGKKGGGKSVKVEVHGMGTRTGGRRQLEAAATLHNLRFT